MRRIGTVLLLALFLAGLLCFPSLSVEGASAGILLWFQRVLPVLLPFVLASRLMAASQLMDRFSPRACGILMGFLCGYPMGAVWAATLVKNGQLTRREGQWMLCFCNQPSPMFLSGYLGLQCLAFFPALPLLACAYVPSLAGVLLSLRSTAGRKKEKPLTPLTLAAFEACFLESCETLLRIGGYILVFSILASWTSLLPLEALPRTFLLGLCEMTTGVGMLGAMHLPSSLAAPLCLGLAVFGGLSCLGQTGGCIRGSGLRLLPYALARLLLGVVSAALLFLWLAVC